MTINEKKIKDYHNNFLSIDSKLGGRKNILLSQWKFELYPYENYSDEDEFLKTIKEVEVMNGNSILFKIFNGKDIKTLSDEIGYTVTKLDYDKIIENEMYYFVAYVYQ